MSKDFGSITKDHLVVDSYFLPIYHMDIEVLPHWWSIVFRHQGKKTVFTADDYDLKALNKLCRTKLLTAYNAKRYDLKILYAICQDVRPELIYMLSKAIIENNGKSEDIRLAKYLRSAYWTHFNFIDLLDDMTGSLKEHEANMGMKILESNISWDKEDLTEEDKIELLYYNNHDVIAQEKVFERRIDGYLMPKLILANIYGLDPVQTLKDTNATLTAKILNARKITKEMTIDRYYELPSHIADYVEKYVDPEIVNTFLTTGMDQVNRKEIKSVGFENKGKFGKGGLHTVMREDMRITNKKHKIFLIDVASYYPNLMIHFNFMSRAVKNRTKFPEIYERRVEAKKNKNKPLDKALKLILNTTFGAMGLKFNKLYDPNMAWSVTITGQLLLSALSNKLYKEANCKIIQTNTDGITLAIQDNNIAKMKQIVSDWEKMTALQMDYDEVEVFAQGNVNNYACKFTTGKTKVKGRLCMQALTCDETAFEVIKYTNWNMRIVHEAVFRYLIYKEPIKETIMNCTDLKMFLTTTKTGTSYERTYHFIDDKEVEVQKVNRVIAIKNKRFGTIKKYKFSKGKKAHKITRAKWNELLIILEDLKLKYDFNPRFRDDAIVKMELINAEIMKVEGYDENHLRAACLREQYDKAADVSEHVAVLNEDLSEYTWENWKDVIDFDFYIVTAFNRIKGWIKKDPKRTSLIRYKKE